MNESPVTPEHRQNSRIPHFIKENAYISLRKAASSTRSFSSNSTRLAKIPAPAVRAVLPAGAGAASREPSTQQEARA